MLCRILSRPSRPVAQVAPVARLLSCACSGGEQAEYTSDSDDDRPLRARLPAGESRFIAYSGAEKAAADNMRDEEEEGELPMWNAAGIAHVGPPDLCVCVSDCLFCPGTSKGGKSKGGKSKGGKGKGGKGKGEGKRDASSDEDEGKRPVFRATCHVCIDRITAA